MSAPNSSAAPLKNSNDLKKLSCDFSRIKEYQDSLTAEQWTELIKVQTEEYKSELERDVSYKFRFTNEWHFNSLTIEKRIARRSGEHRQYCYHGG